MELILRDYQVDIINKTRQSFKDGFKSPLIVLPCGSGKTAVFAWMASQSQANGKIVWFLVHRQELLSQTVETFNRFNIPVDKITIGMVQTIANHLEDYPKPDIIVFDEAHFSAAKTWGKIIEAYPSAYKIGLTATPCRLDGKPLGSIYDTMITGITAKELIADGRLSDYTYLSIPLIKTDDLKSKAGDYDIKQVVDQFQNTVYADVLKTYQERANNKKTICYCPTIEISEKTAEMFQQSGIEAVHFDGNTPEKQRKQIILDFRAGIIKILCNVDLISVGFDVPDCEACILLRPTKSLALFIQQAMRALRPLPGKKAIILDHVCNYLDHGLPDQDRDWSLEKKIKKEKQKNSDEFLSHTCINCYYQFSNKTAICPNCGCVMEREKKEIQHKKYLELQEINKNFQPVITNYKKCKTIAQLHELCKQKGYKPGWAWVKAKELGLWTPKKEQKPTF
jgi:superfamily II DNA or RNA helicase